MLLTLVVAPLLSFYLVTSPEIRSHPPLSRPVAIGSGLAVWSGTIIASNLVCLNRHVESDQIIYSYGFSWLLTSFYLSGWYWPDGTQHLLVRTTIAIGCVVVALFLGTINSILWRNTQLRRQQRSS